LQPLQKFKLRWLRSQELKDKAKASLLTECRKIVFEEPQPGSTSTSSHHTDSAKENDFFSFDKDEEDTSSSAEKQVADYRQGKASLFI